MDDLDPTETREWLEALDSICRSQGDDRASYILAQLNARATENGIDLPQSVTTHFCNTIPAVREKIMPGDLFMERRIRSLVRWNALAMVMRANAQSEGIGGHIASFSSAATLYDVGFNYFFRGSSDDVPGDLVFFQGHSSPGMYARSFLEGRLSVEQLDKFRREVDGTGLSSYPHPWLMPDYWQFPTVSMGLGPIQAIYQAHVMRYLSARDLVARGNRKVWAFLGDGECDEPETLGAISLAGREGLENLIFVINCNLQRLDGPVRGNGKIIQELEGVFRGAGWNVIKVIWGRHWDQLLERDKSGLLLQRMNEVCDGELQNYKYNGGAYTREHFFGKYPELLELVKDMTDDQIMALNRGGHDPYKVYAAYSEAVESKGHPTVILAHTVKGYGLGAGGQAANDTHSVKKLDVENLRIFRDRFGIPISDDQLETVPYYRPEENSPELIYMNERRASLGGPLPSRKSDFEEMSVPALKVFDKQLDSSGEREISSTMAFVRILSTLIKNKDIGQYVVPIVPDEARTFGMEGMFRQLGIYTSAGQKYVPHDREQIMYYKEDKKGVILEEGINEAGAMSAWLALATAYSTSSRPMIPFYIFYSMFGFQRIGDLAWASGDCQARGFLIGATAGRTTLNGEGLQHQDGHSLLLASTIPACQAYDPAFAYEVAALIRHGLTRMYGDNPADIFYYITLYNENILMPPQPKHVSDADIVNGLYRWSDASTEEVHASILFSGTAFKAASEASSILRDKYNINTDLWSATSYKSLRDDAMEVERWNRLRPTEAPRESLVQSILGSASTPIVAVTDFMRIVSEQIAPYISPRRFIALGTDGMGRSDTREALRHFFETDAGHVVVAVLTSLIGTHQVTQELVQQAIKDFNIDPDALHSLSRD